MPSHRSAQQAVFARAIIAVLVVSALALGTAQTASATPVACGDTITSSVRLTTDLVCAGPGLFVQGDNITVNFEGHSLTGPSPTQPYTPGVDVFGNNVTVENGTIKGFVQGADTGGFNTTFLRMTITGNGYGIAEFPGATGMRVTDSAVDANRNIGITGNGLSVSGSRVVHNGGNGIVSINNGLFVSNSRVSENGGYGIADFNQSAWLTNNVINNNTVFGASPYGIGVDILYLKGNKFRNSPVIIFDTMTIVDLGGNLCAVGTAPFLPCIF